MNYPTNIYNPLPLLSTVSPQSIGTQLRESQSSLSTASKSYPTANKAFFYPFVLKTPILVKMMFVANGTNASQTRDIGIYDKNGTRIVSAGSTAGSGTSTLQTFDVTDTTIGPGLFYFAFVSSGTTNSFLSINCSVVIQQMMGMFEMASAFPLPATATFATPTTTSGNFMLMGLATTPLV